MPFKPGQSGNPAGKRKGAISKRARIIQSFAADIVSGGSAKFKKEMDKLEGRGYVDAYLCLLEYVQPKLQRIDHQNDGNNIRIITVTVNEADTNQLAGLESGN